MSYNNKKLIDLFIEHGSPPGEDERAPGDGDMIYIDESKYFPSLPIYIKDSIKSTGYIARFYKTKPVTFSLAIEKCLANEKEIGSIAYSSSITKKTRMNPNAIYHAMIHVSDKDACITTDAYIITVVVFCHHSIPESSVVVISTDDVMVPDTWIDKINEFITNMNRKPVNMAITRERKN